MKEKKSKKEWIKSIAIIFLIVLLILTFFSNTIMNRSLPEVSAQYCYSGQVTNKVRGTGVVEANDPYVVTVKESRKVESVLVREGDTVAVGDVLYTLADGESNELKEALDELEKAQNEYELAIITGAISTDVTDSVEKDGPGSLKANQARITAAKNRIETLQAKVDAIQKQGDEFANGTAGFVKEKKDLADAEKALKKWTKQSGIEETNLGNAEINLGKATQKYDEEVAEKKKKEAELKSYKEQLENLDVSSNDYASELADLEEKIEKTKKDIEQAKKNIKKYEAEKKTKQNEYTNALLAYNNALSMIDYYTELIEQLEETISDKGYSYSRQLRDAQDQLEKAQKDYEDLLEELSTKYGLEDKLNVIKDKQKAVDELKEGSIGGTITAPVAGTIISTSYAAGQTINVESAPEVAQIQKAGDLYSLTMTIPSSQAQLIGVGDEAEVSNSWYYSDVHARVSQIRPSKEDPAKSKTVVFEVEGNDLTDGMSLSLTVGNRTANYDMIVPKSAVREDNNGKFVLKVVSKETPLGIRYIAERVDVKILAEDDINAAISGNMESWEFIITTTSKPVESGSQVRLKE